ncbi:MAG: hypothetical protein WAU62_08860 [Dehalococcoidales bacterium]
MGIIDEKLVSGSVKQLPASCTNNWNHLPLLFALFAAEFEGAYCAAHRTFGQIFPDSMPGREAFCFQYLMNTLSRDIEFFGYFGHRHE